MKKLNDVKGNCFDSALQLMLKFDKPDSEQVYHHMCLQDHCPTIKCTYPLGFREGRSCDYVAAVGLIVGKLKAVRDE